MPRRLEFIRNREQLDRHLERQIRVAVAILRPIVSARRKPPLTQLQWLSLYTLARAAGLADASLALMQARHEIEVATMVRSLLELYIRFAWIVSDESKRQERLDLVDHGTSRDIRRIREGILLPDVDQPIQYSVYLEEAKVQEQEEMQALKKRYGDSTKALHRYSLLEMAEELGAGFLHQGVYRHLSMVPHAEGLGAGRYARFDGTWLSFNDRNVDQMSTANLWTALALIVGLSQTVLQVVPEYAQDDTFERFKPLESAVLTVGKKLDELRP